LAQHHKDKKNNEKQETLHTTLIQYFTFLN